MRGARRIAAWHTFEILDHPAHGARSAGTVREGGTVQDPVRDGTGDGAGEDAGDGKDAGRSVLGRRRVRAAGAVAARANQGRRSLTRA